MNFKQKTRVDLKLINTLRETTFCAWRHVIFAVHSPLSLYCVLTHIPMIWRHDKVVRHRTSRAMSRYSFITTVWWYNVFYQTGDFLKCQMKMYIMLDKTEILLKVALSTITPNPTVWYCIHHCITPYLFLYVCTQM